MPNCTNTTKAAVLEMDPSPERTTDLKYQEATLLGEAKGIVPPVCVHICAAVLETTAKTYLDTEVARSFAYSLNFSLYATEITSCLDKSRASLLRWLSGARRCCSWVCKGSLCSKIWSTGSLGTSCRVRPSKKIPDRGNLTTLRGFQSQKSNRLSIEVM